jgi:hypothetical protein
MFFVALLCVLGAAAQAANATLADLYNAATQEVGSSSDSYTFCKRSLNFDSLEKV